MKKRIRIDVQKLDVLNIRGDAPHSSEQEPVCRAVTTPDSSEVDAKLWDAFQWKEDVILRCASLDVSGTITKTRYHGTEKIYELKVDDIVYRRSGENA